MTDEAWSSLCARFGNETTRTNGQENDDDTHLDLNMIGAYFVNKYDPLLEEIIRRLLIGIVNNSVRSTRLEARLRTVEEHLESTSMREIREREMRINKTLRRWRQQSISVAFDSWKETVAKSREVRERAIRHMMNQALSSTWRRWKEMVSEVQEQRAAVGRAVARIRNRAAALAFEVRSRLRQPPTHTQHRLSRMPLLPFQTWASLVADNKAERERQMRKGLAMFTNGAFVRAFNHWAEEAVQGRKARELQRRILMRMSFGIVYETFAAWVASVAEEADRRAALLKKTAMRMANSCLVKTFEAWRDLLRLAAEEREAAEQRALKFALRLIAPYIGLCFEAWAEDVQRTKRIMRRAAHAIGPGRLLFVVFRTWAHNVREQVRQAQRDWVTDMIEERLPQMIQDTLQKEVIMKLESQQLEANDVTARIMSSTAALQREVDRLRREVDTAQARKMRESEHIANKILRQWKLQFVTKAFGAWQEAVASSKRYLQRAAEYWRTVPLRHAMDEWAAYAESKRHLKRLAALVAGNLAGKVLSVIVREWRVATELAVAMRKSGGLQALGMWVNRTYATFFYPWREYVKRSGRVKVLCRNSIVRMLSRLLAAAFDALVAHVQETLADRQARQMVALRRMMDRGRVLAFQAWHDYTRESIESRNELYSNAVRRFFYRQLALAMDAWCEYIDMRRRLLARAARYFGDYGVLGMCFGKWRALWQHAAEVKKKEWLLQDLRVVGVDWLVEALDQLFATSLPGGSQIHQTLSTALANAPPPSEIAAERPQPRPPIAAEPPQPVAAEETLDDTGIPVTRFELELHLNSAQEDDLVMPRPPPGPRAQPAAPGRSVHARAPSPELIPTHHDPIVEGVTDATPSFAPSVAYSERSESVAGGEQPRSTALHALGVFLEKRIRTNESALQRAMDAHAETQALSNSHVLRVLTELRELRELQVQHARVSYSEAAKRQSESVNLDLRVKELNGRLEEVDEQMVFLKDTLYSVLTSGQGAVIKAPQKNNKPARFPPIKQIKHTKSPFDAAGFDPVAPF